MWNVPGTQKNNNCYNYANDQMQTADDILALLKTREPGDGNFWVDGVLFARIEASDIDLYKYLQVCIKKV